MILKFDDVVLKEIEDRLTERFRFEAKNACELQFRSSLQAIVDEGESQRAGLRIHQHKARHIEIELADLRNKVLGLETKVAVLKVALKLKAKPKAKKRPKLVRKTALRAVT